MYLETLWRADRPLLEPLVVLLEDEDLLSELPANCEMGLSFERVALSPTRPEEIKIIPAWKLFSPEGLPPEVANKLHSRLSDIAAERLHESWRGATLKDFRGMIARVEASVARNVYLAWTEECYIITAHCLRLGGENALCGWPVKRLFCANWHHGYARSVKFEHLSIRMGRWLSLQDIRAQALDEDSVFRYSELTRCHFALGGRMLTFSQCQLTASTLVPSGHATPRYHFKRCLIDDCDIVGEVTLEACDIVGGTRINGTTITGGKSEQVIYAP